MNRRLLLVSLSCVLAFLLLAWLVEAGYTRGFDQSVMATMHATRGPFLNWMMIMVSVFGYAIAAGAIFATLIALLWIHGGIRRAWLALLALIGPAIALGMKYGLQRPRPEAHVLDIYALPADPSFPSGHVVLYTVVFGLMLFFISTSPGIAKPIRYALNTVLAFLIATVGLSRVYLGVHWPTDAIGGYLLGAGVLAFIVYLYYAVPGRRGTGKWSRFLWLPKK